MAAENIALTIAEQLSEAQSKVAELELANAQLRKEQFRTVSILEQALRPEVAYIANADGKTELVSGHWKKYFGVSMEQCREFDWLTSIHPDDVDRVMKDWLACVRDGQPFESEHRLRNAGGNYLWHLSRAVPLRSAAGDITRWVGTLTDIHRGKSLEEVWREREDFLSSVFESGPDCLEVLDSQYHLVDINGPGLALRKIASVASVRGKNWLDFWPLSEIGNVRHALLEAAAGRIGRFEGFFSNTEGSPRHWDSRVTAVRDASGDVRRFICNSRDNTAEKSVETALRNSHEVLQKHSAQLARANEDLMHFAYAVSHDLQAPLRTVTAFSQLLALSNRSVLGAQGDEIIEGIVKAGKRMDTMIRDLLEFARVAGSEIQSAEVELDGALTTALEILKGTIAETGAVITHDSLPAVAGDAGQFAQLFQNLIGNSLKYRQPETPPRIHISARRNEEEWVIGVRDNGIGFAPEYAERIFGVFQRLHSTEIAGTGIGLTICKRIVERLGGRIWAESVPGEGAEFSFSLLSKEAGNSLETRMPAARQPSDVDPIPSEEILFDELFHTLDLAQAFVREMDGTIQIWTKGAERLFGYSKAEAVGRRAQDLLQKVFPKPLAEVEADLLRNDDWAGQLKAKRKDGSIIWLASHLSLHRDGSGRPQSVIEVHNGIDELKEAEVALLRTSEQRDMALRAGRMGIWQGDIVTGVTKWDETYERILGMAPGTFEGTAEAFYNRIHPDDLALVQTQVAEALEKHQEILVEYRIRHLDGGYRWLRSQGRGTYDPEAGQITALMGVAWDITESKLAELDREFLLELSAKLAHGSDASGLVDMAIKEMGTYLGVPRSAYAEFNALGGELVLVSHHSSDGPSLQGTKVSDLGKLDSDMHAAGFLAVSDTETDPRTAECFKTTYGPRNTRAFLSVSIHDEGTWRAILNVTDNRVHYWRQREITLLRGVAERLWPAMENARLLQVTKQQQEQMAAGWL